MLFRNALKQCTVFSVAALCIVGAAAVKASDKAALRCGWLQNPSPQNASLSDRDGEWVISMRGRPVAQGDWPEFGPSQWVRTNGHYGYGCACLRLVANAHTHELSQILSASPRLSMHAEATLRSSRLRVDEAMKQAATTPRLIVSFRYLMKLGFAGREGGAFECSAAKRFMPHTATI